MTATLVIDTSIHGAVIGLTPGCDKRLQYVQSSPDVTDSARLLPLMVADGLSKLGLKETDISKIVVSQGPGSFTGIRVGLAYGSGFLAGLLSASVEEPKILGVSSLLELGKWFSRSAKNNVVIFLPATKTSGYAVCVNGENVRSISVDSARQNLAALFHDYETSHWVVIGDWAVISDLASSRSVKSQEFLSSREAGLKAIHVMAEAAQDTEKLGWARMLADEMPSAIYLRKSTVEEKASDHALREK
jgi:tRNA A37 threonylcarbamoyladenosine modification protein TsaB